LLGFQTPHLLDTDRGISVGGITLSNGEQPYGEEWPLHEDEVQVVFDVRLDGKPHPVPAFALPLIGPFEDWQRAMSWTHRIEWKSPTGVWRQHYHQKFARNLADASSRGSLMYHASSIMVLRWLLREAPD
jgi:hypothetical protein